MAVPFDESVPHRVRRPGSLGRVEDWLHGKRHPQLAVEANFGADEIFGSDADYREAESVQRKLPADDASVRVEARAPEVLAQDDDGNRNLPLLLDESAATEGVNLEHVKIILCHVLTLNGFRLAAPCETKLARTRGGCHPFEALRLLFVIDIVRVRNRRAQPHDVTLLLNPWHGPNEYDVDDAEDRCIETDAERQRHYRHNREARRLPEHPQPVTQVLQ